VTTEQAIVALMRELRAQGRLLLVSTHNLGSVPEYCDHVVLINRRLIAAGPTAETFTQANLEVAFGGVLRHFRLTGDALHDDADARSLTVLTDDERPVVFYGTHGHHPPTEPTPTSTARPDDKQ
jgi:manganese/iron transport system ATP-binding protein